ncbi:hypothetical protein BRE01_60170 [Brevibacillus reuszeri]|uniref:Uncharacterized protein n=1 Tax=Brevibacillus reuszeri TaxID=54915 RepID=A0A0K9YNB5_9BACL|nr:hypothetical protein [Brevibacillus reuszeri]KNB70233.1 hypothetical protein ADS79_14800 [Brevibacillus reuszeri]MED1859190.1 hypothetical protein [Brevibacillus reuszeri]GED72315.1 hypothetical protein BRE01_60170 [Brevibacillus reuszeri]
MKDTYEKQIEDLKRVVENLDQMGLDEPTKRLARSGLNTEIGQLERELNAILRRERTKLRTFEADDQIIEIPKGLFYNGETEYQYHNGAIYQFKRPKLDKDGTMQLYHYIWIDEGKRQIKLSVRTLGRDKFGDRYFLEARYYKDKKDEYPYMTKGIDGNNTKYKVHVKKVIEYIRTHEGFEDFYKQKTQ